VEQMREHRRDVAISKLGRLPPTLLGLQHRSQAELLARTSFVLQCPKSVDGKTFDWKNPEEPQTEGVAVSGLLHIVASKRYNEPPVPAVRVKSSTKKRNVI